MRTACSDLGVAGTRREKTRRTRGNVFETERTFAVGT